MIAIRQDLKKELEVEAIAVEDIALHPSPHLHAVIADDVNLVLLPRVLLPRVVHLAPHLLVAQTDPKGGEEATDATGVNERIEILVLADDLPVVKTKMAEVVNEVVVGIEFLVYYYYDYGYCRRGKARNLEKHE